MRRIPLVLALAASGCIVVTDFEPVGGAASIAGSWTIDGAAPTAESCRALRAVDPGQPLSGADTLVRVVFLDETRPVVHGNLIFVCSVGRFDTMMQKVVAAGGWRVQVQAIDGSSNVLGTGAVEEIDASTGAIALTAVDFGSAQVSAAWSIGGAAPTVTSCGEAGIDRVELSFGGAAASREEPCAVGTIGTHLHPGDYDVVLRALGPAGVVRELPAQALTLPTGVHTRLDGGARVALD